MKIWLRSTTSTMKDAAALALRGEPHGTTVVAEAQTAGIGRHGHSWYSEPHGGLYVSIILRLELPSESLPILTMALGIAAQRAISVASGVICDIRWPNDLLLSGRKVAGTIVQTADSALIAGIGINVNQDSFPEDLTLIATSLRIETDKEHSKETLLDELVAQVLQYAKRLETEGKAAIIREFETLSSYVCGKQVEVTLDQRTIEGITAGLDENGFLRVETPHGIETILAGGVRERKVVITAYDPSWPRTYRAHETRIREALGRRALEVEHVGSTSVPGLAAKAVIDILLVVADSSDESQYVSALEAAGYSLQIREPAWYEHRMLVAPSVNLHVFSTGCVEITRVLAFRDHLRRSESDRELYASVKRELAQRPWKSVQEYADAKSEVISQIMHRTQQSRSSSSA